MASNKEHAARLTDLAQNLGQAALALPVEHEGESAGAWSDKLAGYAETLTEAALLYRALPESASVTEVIEGHSMLQTALFSAMLQLVVIKGLAGKGTPQKKLDMLALKSMMALYHGTNHEKFQERYNAALMNYVQGASKE